MSTLTQTLSNGDTHGLINTMANSVPDNGFSGFDEKTRANLLKQRKEDEKIVKAMYVNSRGGSERLERPYCKYPGQQITQWKFFNNCTYDIPQGLFDEVNAQPELPKRSEILDATGIATKRDGQGEKLHRFFKV